MNAAWTASSASAVTSTSTSSPDWTMVSPRGTSEAVAPDDGHHDGVAGEVQVGDGRVVGRRVLGQGDLDQVGGATLELEQADQRTDRDGLLDQRGEQLGGRDRHVHPPALVEEPLVLRVVDPGHHAGHGELLLGQERDDEVVLVVTGGRHDDVDRGQPGRVERGDLAGVGGDPGDVEGRPQALDQIGILLEHEHVVPAVLEVRGDGGADAAGAGDGDPHDSASLWCPTVPDRVQSSSLRASSSTARCSTSPSWPTSSRASRRGAPARVTAMSETRPGISMSRRARPAQLSGSERSSSESRPLASDQSPVVSSGSRRRRTWSMVHVTVATVGMPEPLVDLGPPGVVDAGHHVGDLVGLPGDAHGQDVGVVPAGDGGQRAGLVRPGLLEVVAVEPRAHDAGAVPVLEAPEGPRRPVQDGHRVALLAQQDGQARAHPATADDDDVHGPQCNTPAGVVQRRSRRGTGLLLLCGRGHPHGVDLAALRRRPRRTGASPPPRPTVPLPGPAAAEIPESRRYRLKNKLLGPPLVTEQLASERLSKVIAMGVLAPDCISSSAYGTEEMLTQMVPYVGLAAFTLVVPITLAILGVLFFVTLSYLEVIQTYTKAGGSYVVARDNFGPRVAQIAAVALLIDYTVTVAVQTSAGTAALTSAVPSLANPTATVAITVAVILVLLYGNLRGIREAGSYFAIPTYFFIFSLASVVIFGLIKEALGQLHQIPLPPANQVYGGKIGTPGSGWLMGLAFISLAALLRQRRVLADRTRGHLQRGEQLPAARGQARPPDPGGHELHAGLPGARRDAAGALDARHPLRPGLADRGVPRGQGGLRHECVGPFRVLHGAAGHHAGALHRREHQLQRLPLPGQLRGRRRFSAPAADQARAPPRVLQRHPGADGGGVGPRARLPGTAQRTGRPLRHRRVHRVHHGRLGHGQAPPDRTRGPLATQRRHQRLLGVPCPSPSS